MTKDQRRKLLAKLHASLKEHNISDEVYREMLRDGEGVASAKTLPEPALLRMIRRVQGESIPPHPVTQWVESAERTITDRVSPAQVRRIEALWAKYARNPDAESLRRFVKKVTGVDKLEWCTVRHTKGIMNALRRIQPKEIDEVSTLQGG
jgi:truncated hemoglobin YjbI